MKKVLIIDFELTCSEDNSITKENAEIIQIGLVEVMISDMSIRRTFMKYVKPENTNISEFCTNLTGITKKQVKNQGLPLEHLINILNNKYGMKNTLVIGWGRDDLFMNFDQYLNLSLLYSIQNGISDKVPLKTALEREGIQFEGSQHDALVDAIATAKLYIKMIKGELNE